MGRMLKAAEIELAMVICLKATVVVCMKANTAVRIIVLALLWAKVISGDSVFASPLESIASGFQKSAQEDMKVERGLFAFTEKNFCDELPICYGNNPTSPYGISYFRTSEHAIGDLRLEDRTSFWRLDKNEAIALFLHPPENVKYFGITGYIFNKRRSGSFADAANCLSSKLGKKIVFASLADTINHLNIKASKEPIGKPLSVVIMASSQKIVEQVRFFLGRAGVEEDAINIIPMDASRLDMGTQPNNATFALLMRIAKFKDQKEKSDYLENPPVRVFKVASSLAADSILIPQRRQGGTGANEDHLKQALIQLEQELLRKYPAPPEPKGYKRVIEYVKSKLPAFVKIFSIGSEPKTIRHLKLKGENCIQNTKNCLGDNSDALYSAGIAGKLDESQDIIVYGVNHALAGKAIYSSIAIYDLRKIAGVGAITDERLEGSAEAYLRGNPFAKYLYVYRLSRNCAKRDSYCFEVKSEGSLSVPPNNRVLVITRAYLEKKTATAPIASELLEAKMIKVDRKRSTSPL